MDAATATAAGLVGTPRVSKGFCASCVPSGCLWLQEVKVLTSFCLGNLVLQNSRPLGGTRLPQAILFCVLKLTSSLCHHTWLGQAVCSSGSTVPTPVIESGTQKC